MVARVCVCAQNSMSVIATLFVTNTNKAALWVFGILCTCYALTYLPSTVGKTSRRWEISTEIDRLKVQRWAKHLHITDQQLE